MWLSWGRCLGRGCLNRLDFFPVTSSPLVLWMALGFFPALQPPCKQYPPPALALNARD